MLKKSKEWPFFLAVVGIFFAFVMPAEALSQGFFRGNVYEIERSAFGEPTRRPGEIAELALLPDGRFRLAVASSQQQGADLWTRGTWRVGADEKDGSNFSGGSLEFSCEDVGGSLSGATTEGGIELIFHPEPFVTKRIFVERRDAPLSPGYGWPARVAGPLSPGASLPGIFWGNLRPSPGASSKGETLLVVQSDGSVSGVALVPSSWNEREQNILSPISGKWSVREGIDSSIEGSLAWSWGDPKPCASWLIPSLHARLEDQGTRLSGSLSLGGVPSDEADLKRIGDGVSSQSENADAVDVTGKIPNGEVAYALNRLLSQNPRPKACDPVRLFPIRINAVGDRIFVRAPDDEKTWLPFPLTYDAAGRPIVNPRGSEGHLVRLGDRSLAAFIVRSVPLAVSGKAFPSFRTSEELVLSLDVYLEPLNRNSVLGSRNDRFVLFAKRVEGAL
ncbi:MAG: hypothetical protein WA705_16380 [Candidatus Ozemobacteraceae bacterium]